MPAMGCGGLLSEPGKAGGLGGQLCTFGFAHPFQGQMLAEGRRGDLLWGQVCGPGGAWAGESAGLCWVPEGCVPAGRLGVARAGPSRGTAAEPGRCCPVFSTVPWSVPTSTSCGSWARRGRSTGPRWSNCTGATRSSRRPWHCPCPRRAAPARAAARPPASREAVVPGTWPFEPAAHMFLLLHPGADDSGLSA